MKSFVLKMVAGTAVLLALIPSASAGVQFVQNSGQIVPDGGASVVLLAIGCSGLAIAAGKRFKR
jgi:hypothetical protein